MNVQCVLLTRRASTFL